jgi:rhodanese-related sulfurtransferase
MEEFVDFAIRHWYLFAALVVIIGALVGGEILRKIRGIAALNPTEAMQFINHDDAVILDIRESGEYKDGHVPNSRNFPFSGLKGRLRELEKLKNKPIIVYCASGARAASAANLLKKSGFQTVHNLSGGLAAWQNANLPISRK